jgi:DHA2 family multidrug resistance protein
LDAARRAGVGTLMTTITHAPPSLDGPPVGAPPPAPFTAKLAIGLAGVLVAAMMSGLNNRVGALGLADVQGALGLDADAGHLLGTVYTAAELAAMPISAWFGVTLSFRRFHLGIVVAFVAIGVLLPFAPDYSWLLALRALQGLAGGAMIPLLMTAALRFLPPPIKLHGLGLYSLTATFAPNVATWLAAAWVDDLGDWRLLYWQVVPAAMIALGAVWWGIPQDPVRTERFREIDWLGLATGPLGLALIAIGLLEGERLDWLHSPAITGALFSGGALFATFLVSEWFHHLPFIKLQLLERRNFWLAFLIFMGILVVLLASAALPADQLVHVQGFRPRELAPIGLIVSLPQLILAPIVSALLYKKWLDARYIMATGLFVVAVGCFLGSYVTSKWMVEQFWFAQACQTIGQPLAVIPLLFLITGVAAPMEGPFVSGLVNMLRSIATIVGSVGIEQGLIRSGAAHLRGMSDRAGRLGDLAGSHGSLARFEIQATTLAIADLYRLMALLAVVLILPTLFLQYLPAPSPPRPAKD